MGSQYGLLLASGARRYCRSAIRGSSLPSFSDIRVSPSALSLSLFPSLFPFLSFSFSSSFRPRSFTIGEIVVRARYEKKRDWSDENPSAGIDAILDMYRDTRGTLNSTRYRRSSTSRLQVERACTCWPDQLAANSRRIPALPRWPIFIEGCPLLIALARSV